MKQTALGAKISGLRIKKGMTQKELAELCNVDVRTIQRIESGEVAPRMYTKKLLAKALDNELSDVEPSTAYNNQDVYKQLKTSYNAGLIFSINYIAVVFDLITHSFPPIIRTPLIIVHIISCVVFFKGFYVLGNYYKNQLLVIASVLSMILLPVINITFLLKSYFFNFFAFSTIFSLVCINAICYGVALLLQGAKRRTYYKINPYIVAGIVTVVQSILMLSLNPDLLNAGLIMSVFCNLVMLKILYTENAGLKKIDNSPATGPVFAT